MRKINTTDQPTIKQLTVDGVELTYQEQGQGETVVLVHGAFSDRRVLESQRTAVAQGYRFIAPNLRYHGNAPWPDEGANYSTATHVSDVAALVQHLDVGPVHVVGWSYGSEIALSLAVQNPEHIRSLFLYDLPTQSIVNNPADIETLGEEWGGLGPAVAASQAGDQRKAVQLFAGWVNEQPFNAINPWWLRTVFLENSRTLPLLFSAPAGPPVTCAQLGQIDVPVTVAKGEDTRPAFAISTDAAHSCFPNSQLAVIPNARHLGPAQNPAAFNPVLLNHLERN